MPNEWRDTFRPCWYCKWFGGLMANGLNGYCTNPKLNPVEAMPERGCAFHEREPGVDDDAWSPMKKPSP